MNGQKYTPGFCPAENVYDICVKSGLIPPRNQRKRGRNPKLVLAAAEAAKEGMSKLDIGRALEKFERGRSYGGCSKEALKKRAGRYIEEGRDQMAKIERLMRGEGREEYERE